MSRILVTEEIAEGGLDLLRAAGHEVDVRLGLSPDELLDAVVGAHGLIIRSATRVTHAVLDAALDLQVVGRAGHRARQRRRRRSDQTRGDGRQRTTVEHRVGRRAHDGVDVGVGPQRPAGALGARRRPLGTKQVGGRRARDKTLGVVGLGRIGKLVADRAKGFGMRLVAYDPFVSEDRAKKMGVEMLDPRPGGRRE
jgi:D-3-phosphoglycerate dehydrogenase